jgi:hypothetical protein
MFIIHTLDNKIIAYVMSVERIMNIQIIRKKKAHCQQGSEHYCLMFFTRMIDRVFGYFNNQILITDNCLATQARLRLKTPSFIK